MNKSPAERAAEEATRNRAEVARLREENARLAETLERERIANREALERLDAVAEGLRAERDTAVACLGHLGLVPGWRASG